MALLEVGKKYEFTTLEWGDEGPGPVTSVWTVEAVEGHLVKLTNPPMTIHLDGLDDDEEGHEMPGRTLILNLTSLYFVSAAPTDKG